jgi:hypothetical protein
LLIEKKNNDKHKSGLFLKLWLQSLKPCTYIGHEKLSRILGLKVISGFFENNNFVFRKFVDCLMVLYLQVKNIVAYNKLYLSENFLVPT